MAPPANTLRTTAELTSALDTLQNVEAEVTASLTNLLGNSEPIEQALRGLNALSGTLAEMGEDAKSLNVNVVKTAATAERVGGRVKALDEEMRRVREASERVGMVMELKVRAQIYSDTSIYPKALELAA